MEPLEEAQAVFGAFSRSLKRISLHRHARDQHAAFLAPAHAAFATLLGKLESLTVGVEPDALVVDGVPVYAEQAREGSLCFRLHRDGVRTLTFLRGLDAHDLLTFVGVALPDERGHAGPGREDAVTELWKADLVNLTYTAVSGYQMEQLQASGEDFLDALSEAAARATGSLDRFADGFSPAEEQEEKLRPALLSPAARGALDERDPGALARRICDTILEIVERDFAGRDLASLEEAYGRLLEALLARRDRESLAMAVSRPAALTEPRAAGFRAALGRRLADPERLRNLLVFCAEEPPILRAVLPGWLQLLPADAGGVVLDALEAETSGATTALLAGAAVARLEGCRDAFAQLLRGARPPLTRALLAALLGLPSRQRGLLAVPALGHRALEVQLAAVALVGADEAVALQHLGKVLSADTQELRCAAAQALGECRSAAEEAAGLLLARMAQPAFAQAARPERIAFYRALGRLGSDQGFAWLADQLRAPRRGLLLRRPGEEEQLLALRGLAAEASARSLALFEEIGDPRAGHPPAVVNACQAAAVHLRSVLAPGAP